MNKVTTVWNTFLTNVIIETFGEFLNKDEIKERVDWIMTIYTKINPDILYKNLVYMLKNNAISEVAIGYKLHFLTNDYKELFNNPYTEEYDRNPHLSESEKALLDSTIDNFGSIINHHIELLISNREYSGDLAEVFNQNTDFYGLTKFTPMSSMYVESNNIAYRLNFGQILYFVVFNQNPIDGSSCSEGLIYNIREQYHKRVEMMETLKGTWPHGIPLKYTSSKKLF